MKFKLCNIVMLVLLLCGQSKLQGSDKKPAAAMTPEEIVRTEITAATVEKHSPIIYDVAKIIGEYSLPTKETTFINETQGESVIFWWGFKKNELIKKILLNIPAGGTGTLLFTDEILELGEILKTDRLYISYIRIYPDRSTRLMTEEFPGKITKENGKFVIEMLWGPLKGRKYPLEGKSFKISVIVDYANDVALFPVD